jgi:hypothetical protein
MSVDLIDRVLYLKKCGDEKPLETVLNWITENQNQNINEFKNDGIEYYWKIISSFKFKEYIDEDLTEWFLLFSKKDKFKALAKIQDKRENLIGKTEGLEISTIWLFKSNFDKLIVEDKPILIWSPHSFERPLENINYDFNQLITKLKNPKIKLTEFVLDRKSKTNINRIR